MGEKKRHDKKHHWFVLIVSIGVPLVSIIGIFIGHVVGNKAIGIYVTLGLVLFSICVIIMLVVKSVYKSHIENNNQKKNN